MVGPGSMWNERYNDRDYVYGEDPNAFLKACLDGLSPGTILFPAEGEGRNAVFAARMGWKVSAFDQSTSGKVKADQLAIKYVAQIDYRVGDLASIEYDQEDFDALALVYAHFPAENRRKYHKKLVSYLKEGAVLILEAFSKSHVHNQVINPQVGGPKRLEMLYDLEELKQDFDGFQWELAVEVETELNEGKLHRGKASVIRLFGIKNKKSLF